MKIRGVCVFISAKSYDELVAEIKGSVDFFKGVAKALKTLGYPLQMLRFATNSFEEWAPLLSVEDQAKALRQIVGLDKLCYEVGAMVQPDDPLCTIISIGDARSDAGASLVKQVVLSTDLIFCTMDLGVGSAGCPDILQARRYANVVLSISRDGPGLITSGPLKGMPYAFRLTVRSNCGHGTPFFPGSSAPSPNEVAGRVKSANGDRNSKWSTPAFAIATENSDLLCKAFASSSSVENVGDALRKELQGALQPLEAMAQRLATDYKISYAGCDTSIASAAQPEHSVTRAWSSLLQRTCRDAANEAACEFGGTGTLTISAIVTAALKNLDGITTVGYAGLMLPQTEDDGLAALPLQGVGGLSIATLLLNSAVCGTGLDTVLVPGATTADELAFLYCDVATMAHRLNKPLSCRVWPAPGHKAGALVKFACPFFVNSAVLPLRSRDHINRSGWSTQAVGVLGVLMVSMGIGMFMTSKRH